MSTAIILINSSSVLDIDKSQLNLEGVKIYCADGGANYAHKLGITPDTIVGDLDSIDKDLLETYRAAGINIVHDPNQDNTDLEVAIDFAIKEGAKKIQIAGSLAGRPDQALGNFIMLANPAFKSLDLSILAKNSLTFVMQTGDTREFSKKKWRRLSLIPIKDSIISLKGTKWELDKRDMSIGSSEGLSNLIESDKALVEVHKGTAFVTHSANVD